MIEAADMRNNLCGECDGRGFHWQTGKIVCRETGRTKAATYKQGPTCQACNGTGQRDHSGKLMAAFAALAIIVFLAFYFGGKLAG